MNIFFIIFYLLYLNIQDSYSKQANKKNKDVSIYNFEEISQKEFSENLDSHYGRWMLVDYTGKIGYSSTIISEDVAIGYIGKTSIITENKCIPFVDVIDDEYIHEVGCPIISFNHFKENNKDRKKKNYFCDLDESWIYLFKKMKLYKTSFDCLNPNILNTELLICNNEILANLDIKLDELYNKYSTLEEEQKEWIKKRNELNDITSLIKIYKDKINLILNTGTKNNQIYYK
jgi:hypothetical protein